MQYLWLIPVGFGVGACGTLIGAGGGFVLMPILLLVYPADSPALLTSISLAVVFFNAASGSWAYHRMRRIDYKSGWLFSAGTVPGAILGALTANYIPRRQFDAVFGLLMLAASAYLLLHPDRKRAQQNPHRDRRGAYLEAPNELRQCWPPVAYSDSNTHGNEYPQGQKLV